MKKTLLALFGLMLSIGAIAQYPLEHTFVNSNNVKMLIFTNAGYKWADYDNDNSQIRLYDMNYNLWKTLTVPQYTGYTCTPAYALWISDNLFDTDAQIEFVMYYNGVGSNIDKIEVLKENGSVIQTFFGTNSYFIVPNDNGQFKLLIKLQDTTNVYALPGNIPCNPCSSLSVAMNKGVAQMPGISEPVPNPSNNTVSISYTLPGKESEGTISITNVNGQEVKSYKVDGRRQSLTIDNSTLPAGNYFYRLVSEAGVSESRKMTILK